MDSKCACLSKLSYALPTLAVIASLFVLVEIVVSDNANFVIQPQEERIVTLSLQKTNSGSGSFSVVSNDDTGIHFWVIDPKNQTALRFNNTQQRSFSFVAQTTGNYQLHFDNSISSDYTKTVALNYDVTHYIMGLPQEQFLLVVIAIVALIGVVIYVALMPK